MLISVALFKQKTVWWPLIWDFGARIERCTHLKRRGPLKWENNSPEKFEVPYIPLFLIAGSMKRAHIYYILLLVLVPAMIGKVMWRFFIHFTTICYPFVFIEPLLPTFYNAFQGVRTVRNFFCIFCRWHSILERILSDFVWNLVTLVAGWGRAVIILLRSHCRPTSLCYHIVGLKTCAKHQSINRSTIKQPISASTGLAKSVPVFHRYFSALE